MEQEQPSIQVERQPSRSPRHHDELRDVALTPPPFQRKLLIECSLLDALNHQKTSPKITTRGLKLRKLYHSVFFRTFFLTAACLLLVLIPFIEHQTSFTQSTSYDPLEEEKDHVKRKYMWGSMSTELVLLIIVTIDAVLRGILIFPPDISTKSESVNNQSNYIESGFTVNQSTVNQSVNNDHFVSHSSETNQSQNNTFNSTEEDEDTPNSRRWSCQTLYIVHSPWCIYFRFNFYIYLTILIISWLFLLITIFLLSFHESRNGYTNVLNILTITRQLFRPVFLIAQVTVIKKTLKAIFLTTLQLVTAFILFFLVIFIFVMAALAIFPHHLAEVEERTTQEGNLYFNSTSQAFWSLIVYLSTANSPDVITPAYNHHRVYFFFFGTFFVVTGYLLLKVITALYAIRFIVFLKESVKRTHGYRVANLARAFTIMTGKPLIKSDDETLTVDTSITVHKDTVWRYIKKLNICSDSDFKNNCDNREELNWEEFKSLFLKIFDDVPQVVSTQSIHMINFDFMKKKKLCLSGIYFICFYYMSIVSLPITMIHAISLASLLSFEYRNSLTEPHSKMAKATLFFSCILIPELVARIIVLLYQILKVCRKSKRPKLVSLCKWMFYGHNYGIGFATKQLGILLLDCIDIFLLIGIITLGFVHIPCLHGGTYDNCLDISNLFQLIQWTIVLVTLRMFRMIMKIPSFAILIHSLLRILIVFIPFIMLAYILYYEFAIIGMAAFRGTNLTDQDAASDCGSYENLEYHPYNFEDFGSSLVLLWNLMIVNNWHIIVDAYVRRHSNAVRIYFILWWLISETIINGVLFGIVLEILSKSMESFFNLVNELREEKSLSNRITLVAKEYLWWGPRRDEDFERHPVFDYSWDIHNVLDEVCNEEKVDNYTAKDESKKKNEKILSDIEAEYIKAAMKI